MKNLFIEKRITEDKELSDEAFVVWCGLRNIMQMNVMEYFVSFNMIAHSVFNRVPGRYELEAIKKGYIELVEKEYIKELAEFSKTEHYVDLSELYFEKGKGFFTDLSKEEMHKIMNINGNHNKYKLLRYFTAQVGSFNHGNEVPEYVRGKIGGMSLDYFSNLLPITKPTCIAFNEILEQNALLFVIRHKDFFSFKGEHGQEIREIPNTYSRWKDKELAKAYSETINGYKYLEQQKGTKTAQANRRRSLGQKLKLFVNGLKEYDIETIKELYAYAYDRNKKMKDEYNREIVRGFTPAEPQYVDMDKFDDCLIYFDCEEGEENE
jgi:hypothetical protein